MVFYYRAEYVQLLERIPGRSCHHQQYCTVSRLLYSTKKYNDNNYVKNIESITGSVN